MAPFNHVDCICNLSFWYCLDLKKFLLSSVCCKVSSLVALSAVLLKWKMAAHCYSGRFSQFHCTVFLAMHASSNEPFEAVDRPVCMCV